LVDMPMFVSSNQFLSKGCQKVLQIRISSDIKIVIIINIY